MLEYVRAGRLGSQRRSRGDRRLPEGSRDRRCDRTGTALLEHLEGRALLAAVFWDGGGDGTNWHDRFNWSGNAVPTASDDAVIDVPGTSTIKFTSVSGSRSVGSLVCEEDFVLGGGTLTIARTSTIDGSFTMSNGTLAGAGNVTMTSEITWTDGAMAGPGHTIFAPGSTAALMNHKQLVGRVVDNYGTVNYSSGALLLGGGVFNNFAGGVFNASSQGGIHFSAGNNLFYNAGTFNRTGSSSFTFNHNVPFTNVGVINVLSGAMTLAGGVTNYEGMSHTLTGGTWNVANSATLTIPSAVIMTLTGGASVRLAGPNSAFGALNGLTNNNGFVTLADGRAFSFVPLAGIFHNPGEFIKAGTGTTTIPASITLDNTGRVCVTGGQLEILGPIVQLVNGQLTGGEWCAQGGGLDVPFADIEVNNAVITLAGAGDFNAFNRLRLNNGSITLDNHGFSFNPTAHIFNNPGTFVVTGGVNVVVPAGTVFNNTGDSVHVLSGTLTLEGGGTHTGDFEVVSGSTLLFNGGDNLFMEGSAIYGAGDVVFAAGINTIDGQVLITGAMTVSGGVVTLADPASVAGSLNNSANLVVAQGAALTVAGDGSNSGTATVNGGQLKLLGGGTHSGDVVLALDGQLKLGGNHTFGAGADITGTGGFEFVSGTSVINGAVNISGTALFTGTSETFGSTFHAGAIVISAASTVSFSAATDATSLDDFGTLSMVGPGGTLLVFGGGSQIGFVTLSGGASVSLGGTYTFSGTSTVSGTGTFINQGTLIRTGTGTTTFGAGVIFDNPGMLEWTGGTLNLNGTVVQVVGNGLMGGTWCGSDPGSLNLGGRSVIEVIGSGATVMLTGPNSGFAALNSLNRIDGWLTISSGRNFVAAGAVTINGNLMVGPGSTFTVSGGLTNAGTVSLPGGTLRALGGGSQSGDFTVYTLSGVEFAGNHTFAASSRITGAGNVTFSGGTSVIGGTLSVTGTVRFAGNDETFTGTYQAGTTSIETASVVKFNGTTAAGTLNLLSGGTMVLNANASAVSVNNAGVIRLTTMTLTVTGGYTQTGAGTLNADLGGTSTYGRVNAGGGLTLGGTVGLALVNAFSPARGDRFDVLTGTPVTGTFATFNPPPTPAEQQWVPIYLPGGVQFLFTSLADVDHDGSVTPSDVAAFINVWSTSLGQGTLAGDFDHNGVVEPADVALFIVTWLHAL